MNKSTRLSIAKTLITAARALEGSRGGWSRELSDYVMDMSLTGDRWNVLRETDQEWRAERNVSVTNIWVKDYDGVLSVAGVLPTGRKFKKVIDLDDKAVKKLKALIDKINKMAED